MTSDNPSSDAFYDRLWSREWRSVNRASPLGAVRHRLVLREARPWLQGRVRVLDVGCGNGALLAEICAIHPEANVTGVDFSRAAFDAAPPQLAGRLLVGDVTKLPELLQGQSFDLVLCCEVLEHVEDPAAVLAGIAGVAREGAGIVITVPARQRYWSSLDEAAGHLRRFEPDAFQRLLMDAGLEPRNLFTWGGPFGRVYYRLARMVGAGGVSKAAGTRTGAIAAKALTSLFRLDDLFAPHTGFQLVASAVRGSVRS